MIGPANRPIITVRVAVIASLLCFDTMFTKALPCISYPKPLAIEINKCVLVSVLRNLLRILLSSYKFVI